MLCAPTPPPAALSTLIDLTQRAEHAVDGRASRRTIDEFANGLEMRRHLGAGLVLPGGGGGIVAEHLGERAGLGGNGRLQAARCLVGERSRRGFNKSVLSETMAKNPFNGEVGPERMLIDSLNCCWPLVGFRRTSARISSQKRM